MNTAPLRWDISIMGLCLNINNPYCLLVLLSLFCQCTFANQNICILNYQLNSIHYFSFFIYIEWDCTKVWLIGLVSLWKVSQWSVIVCYLQGNVWEGKTSRPDHLNSRLHLTSTLHLTSQTVLIYWLAAAIHRHSWVWFRCSWMWTLQACLISD